jgi:hypothetical protein
MEGGGESPPYYSSFSRRPTAIRDVQEKVLFISQLVTQKNVATEESLFVPCTEDIYKFVSPRIHAGTRRPRN